MVESDLSTTGEARKRFYALSSQLNSRTHDEDVSGFEISVKNPIGMQVMNAIEDLIEERFDHRRRFLQRFLVRLRSSMEFDDVPLIEIQS